MRKRLYYILLVAGVLTAATLAAFTLPASAEKRTIYVQLVTGEIVPVVVDVEPGTPLNQIQLPGTPVPGPAPAPQQQPTTPTTPAPGPNTPTTETRKPQRKSGSKKKARRKKKRSRGDTGGAEAPVELEKRARKRRARTRLRHPDGSPTRTNPGFVDALPGPSRATGVPNFIIRKFRVPIFLLRIYQAAAIQYGVRWEVLAAVNEIETDYGRNLNVSSAGAVGWMQFLPSTWEMYGTDANEDGREDPYNPVDAIFAAARYLKAAGYEEDPRRAIFAYNHTDWYVDSVMLRARLIAGVPADLVGSLTGLTEARFPVYARARYADDLREKEALKRVKRGQNAANLVESKDDRRGVEIFTRRGAPVVATNDGVIKKIGRSKRLGLYMVLQDVYGNRFLYARLGSRAKYYPVPKDEALDPKRSARAVKANDDAKDPKPTKPASAGRQVVDDSDRKTSKSAKKTRAEVPQATVPVKERLFANPNQPQAREAGGLEQVLEYKARKKGGFETYRNYFSRPFGLDAKDVRLKRLRVGSRVIGGTVLGKVDRTGSKAAHLYFEIRPAGRGAPRIDPKPILDGWKLLEATSVYRTAGKNVLTGGFSIGQVLLMPKPQLERRVLGDERIEIYDCGRTDIRSGQIHRRVLATLAYLAESGLRPTATSLKCGHSFYTSSGGVSHHSSGNAVDIAKINGVPILGHQEPGGITEQTVKRLLQLQGSMRPDQIITLREMGGPTIAMSDHHDHIHVGFRPMFGENTKQGKQAFQILKPGQWSDLLKQLRKIKNPVVPTKPSKFAVPVEKKKRSSDAHSGE
jgi:Transglycosylase SLT domain